MIFRFDVQRGLRGVVAAGRNKRRNGGGFEREGTLWYVHQHAVAKSHEFLGSATPAQAYRNKAVPLVLKDAKAMPEHIEVKRFTETRITGYRLKQAA